MNLFALLVRMGIQPELVLAMRHAVSRKQFWPQSDRKVFEDYQRGLGQGQKTMLNNKKYIASFVGHKSGQAMFVGLYRVDKTRRMSAKSFYRMRQNRKLLNLGMPRRNGPRYWIDQTRLRRFGYLESTLIVRWAGVRQWCQDVETDKFTILSGGVVHKSSERSEHPPLKELIHVGRLDEQRQVRMRLEQRFLRKYVLKGRDCGSCYICGEELPVRLLVAAHLKPRWQCSQKEKRDLNNVVPMCLLGCDALFEGGYLMVVNDRVVVRSDEQSNHAALRAIKTKLQGRPISVEAKRRPYFQWHAKQRRERNAK
jgi:hypothetical protein